MKIFFKILIILTILFYISSNENRFLEILIDNKVDINSDTYIEIKNDVRDIREDEPEEYNEDSKKEEEKKEEEKKENPDTERESLLETLVNSLEKRETFSIKTQKDFENISEAYKTLIAKRKKEGGPPRIIAVKFDLRDYDSSSTENSIKPEYLNKVMHNFDFEEVTISHAKYDKLSIVLLEILINNLKELRVLKVKGDEDNMDVSNVEQKILGKILGHRLDKLRKLELYAVPLNSTGYLELSLTAKHKLANREIKLDDFNSLMLDIQWGITDENALNLNRFIKKCLKHLTILRITNAKGYDEENLSEILTELKSLPKRTGDNEMKLVIDTDETGIDRNNAELLKLIEEVKKVEVVESVSLK